MISLASPAMQLAAARGWSWKEVDSSQVELEECPYCNKTGFGHFYMEARDPQDEYANRDGLHTCHKCGKNGNLFSLKAHLGITTKARTARRKKGPDVLPDVEACHAALLADAEALSWLEDTRGFSRAIIERQKLGLTKHYFREAGNARAIVYPYLVNGVIVWAHYRTLPAMSDDTGKVPRAFSSPAGYDAVLYNGEILGTAIKDIVLVEGEADTIAALDKGIENICGVPGANIKKAEWIDALAAMDLERIYIWYDKDKAGQKAAQTLASRIGIEKCWSIVLPNFSVTIEGETRKGKDANEWFAFGGGTLEGFEALKRSARMFDVAGVSSVTAAIQDFYEELGTKGIAPKYKTQWPSLNVLVGFDEGDVIDILAPEKIGKTTFGLNLMEHMVDKYQEHGVIICLEMTQLRLARKYVAMVAGLQDNIPTDRADELRIMSEFKAVEPYVQEHSQNRPGQLYFAYPIYRTVDDIYTLIRDCHRRYGVQWVMLDNIQRLCDTTVGSKNRTQHLSEISKVTSQMAKDYKLQMVRILQPHRLGLDSKGFNREVTTDNVDGASQIAKDCDCMVTLHRIMTEPGVFSSDMKVVVGLSRYSVGGKAELVYDGARSTVTEKNALAALMTSVELEPELLDITI